MPMRGCRSRRLCGPDGHQDVCANAAISTNTERLIGAGSDFLRGSALAVV